MQFTNWYVSWIVSVIVSLEIALTCLFNYEIRCRLAAHTVATTVVLISASVGFYNCCTLPRQPYRVASFIDDFIFTYT